MSLMSSSTPFSSKWQLQAADIPYFSLRWLPIIAQMEVLMLVEDINLVLIAVPSQIQGDTSHHERLVLFTDELEMCGAGCWTCKSGISCIYKEPKAGLGSGDCLLCLKQT